MVINATEAEVLARVIKVIAGMLQVFNRDVSINLTSKTNIHIDLGIDSVELLDLLCALEKEFSITIVAEKAARVKTIDDIVRFIINS